MPVLQPALSSSIDLSELAGSGCGGADGVGRYLPRAACFTALPGGVRGGGAACSGRA